MAYAYMWWHRVVLAHRINGPRPSMDISGRFDVYTCQCRKVWVTN